MGEVTIVSTPDTAFVITPMGTQDLPQSQRDALKGDGKTEVLSILRNVDKPGYTFTMTGSEKVDAIDAQVLAITADGTDVKWWVDPATGRLLRRAAKGRQGEQVTTTLSDWKTFGGLNFATTFISTANGEQVASGKVTNVEVNSAIDPKVFEKPASK